LDKKRLGAIARFKLELSFFVTIFNQSQEKRSIERTPTSLFVRERTTILLWASYLRKKSKSHNLLIENGGWQIR
jgi:hypothetical protein